ncbi:MAG: hypothetical protein ACP5KN_11540 [Armatimonadota bacterium]
MAARVKLRLVENAQEMADSITRFSEGAEEFSGRARRLLSQSAYWVYFPATGQFGPSKFAGFAKMDFPLYERVLSLDEPPAIFDGERVRRRIVNILDAEFEATVRMGLYLIDWADELLGVPDILGSVDHTKWRFVRLPADVSP